VRGIIPIQIVVPTQGLVANVPNYQVPAGGLVDGSNVFVDIDGLLKTRLGYSPVGSLFLPQAITSISESGSVVTVVLASPLPAHLGTSNTTVVISGVGVTSYNGTYCPITVTGANTFTFVSGSLGLPALLATLAQPSLGTATLGERVNGIISYRDTTGDFVDVVATVNRWWLYNNDGTFTDISGGALLTGDPDDPTRLVAFQQSGLVWVYGVDNTTDGLYAWNGTLGAYISIVGNLVTPITSATETGTTVTVTSPANPIGIAIGDTVVITGGTVSNYR